ncbi:MAG: hypothetical protein LBD59_08280 [Prevotellaceae bacterium]|jgi:hypothetical protein|nr:hypothetical protein [Prevotellaceae bacterium]
MLGFEVKFNGQLIHASIGDEGVLPVIMSCCHKCFRPEDNGTHLYIGGLDNFNRIRWFYGNIDEVEQVSIKVIDVQQNSPLSSCEPQNRSKLLKEYEKLKKELQKEGLI